MQDLRSTACQHEEIIREIFAQGAQMAEGVPRWSLGTTGNGNTVVILTPVFAQIEVPLGTVCEKRNHRRAWYLRSGICRSRQQ
jgi:hypothetical protein